MPLTDASIRTAKPDTKPIRLFDGGGLYVEISTAGGKLWRLKYRFDGKEKRLALGAYPQITLAEARGRRGQARKLLSEGIDPSEQRKADKAAHKERTENNFEAVTREWAKKQSSIWTPAYAERLLSRFERDVFPAIGKRPIAEIKPTELLAALRKIEARRAIETAHRARAECGQVFR